MTVYKNERKGKEEKHGGGWRDRRKGRRKKEEKGKGIEREREKERGESERSRRTHVFSDESSGIVLRLR